MIIEIGEVYMDAITNIAILMPNKTRKYLLPCLNDYGQEFMDKINNVFKIAAGVGDMVVTNNGLIKYEKHIFLLLDSSIATQFFIKFLDWVREQEMYQDDYVYDNIQKTTYHMIVIRFPDKYSSSFEVFLKGKYSEMFKNPEDFDFFKNNPDVKKVFVKDHNYKIRFVKELNEIFDTTIKPSEYNGELELPPTDETEIFNHHLKKINNE